MPDLRARNRKRDKQKIPHIERKNATRILGQLTQSLDGCGDAVAGLRMAGFAHFLTRLEDPVLELAVQPDSWGERVRARLVSIIMGELRGIPAESATIEEIVAVSNVVLPCFLLELGRRKQHIAVEFPTDPCYPGARFGLRVGPSQPMHSVTSEQLRRLVTEIGEELVGLCYFGDQQSRDIVEAQLNRGDAVANLKVGALPASSSSSSPKRKR